MKKIDYLIGALFATIFFACFTKPKLAPIIIGCVAVITAVYFFIFDVKHGNGSKRSF